MFFYGRPDSDRLAVLEEPEVTNGAVFL